MAEEMQMPNMNGANMDAENPMRNLPPEAMKNLLQPDEEIAAMLVARLSAMSEQELRHVKHHVKRHRRWAHWAVCNEDPHGDSS